MAYLIISIICGTAIFVIFRSLEHYKLQIFPVLVVNYIVAALSAFTALNINRQPLFVHPDWLIPGGAIGIIFVVMFFVIARSAQKAGITITTVSSKISVIMPITFSFIYDPSDQVTHIKIIGIFLSLVAIFLTLYKKDKTNISKIYLPLILFLGAGIIDSLLKYVQFHHVSNDKLAQFTTYLFFVSSITIVAFAVIKGLSRKAIFNTSNIAAGIILGVVNWASIFFLIYALNYRNSSSETIASSIIFGINNLGTVLLSVILGWFIFKEQLTIINRAGIVLSLIAIYILTIY